MNKPYPVAYRVDRRKGYDMHTVIIRETLGSQITETTYDLEDGWKLETVSYSSRPQRVQYTHARGDDYARPYVRWHNQRVHLDDFAAVSQRAWAGTQTYHFAHGTSYFSAFLLLDDPEYDGEYARIAYSHC